MEKFEDVWKCECEKCTCETKDECLLICAVNNTCNCCGVLIERPTESLES